MRRVATSIDVPGYLRRLGLGAGRPPPLAEGDYRQGPFRYGLRPSPAERAALWQRLATAHEQWLSEQD
jgi:hypothetical protein